MQGAAVEVDFIIPGINDVANGFRGIKHQHKAKGLVRATAITDNGVAVVVDGGASPLRTAGHRAVATQVHRIGVRVVESAHDPRGIRDGHRNDVGGGWQDLDRKLRAVEGHPVGRAVEVTEGRRIDRVDGAQGQDQAVVLLGQHASIQQVGNVDAEFNVTRFNSCIIRQGRGTGRVIIDCPVDIVFST